MESRGLKELIDYCIQYTLDMNYLALSPKEYLKLKSYLIKKEINYFKKKGA